MGTATKVTESVHRDKPEVSGVEMIGAGAGYGMDDVANRRASLSLFMLLGVFFLLAAQPYPLARDLGEWLFSWLLKPSYLNTSEELRTYVTRVTAVFLYLPWLLAAKIVFSNLISERNSVSSAPTNFRKWFWRVNMGICFLGLFWNYTGNTVDTVPDPTVKAMLSLRVSMFAGGLLMIAGAAGAGVGLSRLAGRWSETRESARGASNGNLSEWKESSNER